MPVLYLGKRILEYAKPILVANSGHGNRELNKQIIGQMEKQKFIEKVDQLPRQLIHRDIHPSNMLFQDGEVTGYLDFELSEIGPRIFDPCYCALHLLYSGFGHEQSRQWWLELLNSLFKGYATGISLQKEEICSIPKVLFSIELLFSARYFELGHQAAAKEHEQVLFWLHKNHDKINNKIPIK